MEIFGLSFPIIITLFFSFWLFVFPKKRSLPSTLLGLFFLFFVIALFAILFQYLQEFYPVIRNYFHIFERVFYAVMLCLPALVFYYVISLTDYIKSYVSFSNFIPHLFIPLLSILFNLYAIYMNSTNEDFIYRATEFFNFFSLKVVFVLLNIYYIIKVIIFYKRHRKRLTDVLSHDCGVSFNWILFFLLGYVLFVLCFFMLSPDSSLYIIYLPLVLLSTYLFFQRNAQINISLEDLSVTYNEAQKDTSETLSVEEIAALILDNDKRLFLKENILKIMSSEQPYLKTHFTIYELTKLVETNITYLSFVLNNDFKLNFVSFINTYRIEKAKALFLDKANDKFTIESIGKKVGFHSKSAFNAAFKKITKTTPSKFKKNRES